MPISRLLIDGNFTPEEQHVLQLAFNNTLRKLNLVDRNDPICEMVARKVIEIAATGVTNALAISRKWRLSNFERKADPVGGLTPVANASYWPNSDLHPR